MMKNGASSKTKDRLGWRIMDEAIQQQNINLLALVFDNMSLQKKQKWETKKVVIAERLNKIPDFYLEMDWEC